ARGCPIGCASLELPRIQMKTHPLFFVVTVLVFSSVAAAMDLATPLAAGLKNPSAATVGAGGKVFVAVADASDKDAKAAIVLIENGKAVPLATGLNSTRALAA